MAKNTFFRQIDFKVKDIIAVLNDNNFDCESTTTKSTRNAESVLFDNLHTIEHFITSEIGILLHIFSNRIILGDVTPIAD